MEKLIPEYIELTGKRVILKTTPPAAYPHMKRILEDDKTMVHIRFMIPQDGWTDEKIKRRYENLSKLQKEQRGIYFAIFDKGTDKVCGGIGFNYINLQWKNGNFGIIIHNQYWGTYVATEASLLCLEYAFEKLGLHRVEITTGEDNVRALKFFDKIGAKPEGVRKDTHLIDGKYISSHVYTIFDNEWSEVKKLLIKLSA